MTIVLIVTLFSKEKVMTHAIEYRRIAQEHRLAAAREMLPNVREMHLNSAEKLEILADEMDHITHGATYRARRKFTH